MAEKNKVIENNEMTITTSQVNKHQQQQQQKIKRERHGRQQKKRNARAIEYVGNKSLLKL